VPLTAKILNLHSSEGAVQYMMWGALSHHGDGLVEEMWPGRERPWTRSPSGKYASPIPCVALLLAVPTLELNL
jgi:hypothetical protein